MSGDAKPGVISDLLAGRWQVPLALLAAIAGTISVYRLLPVPPTVNLDSVLADAALLRANNETDEALRALSAVLEQHPTLAAEQRALVHDALADILYESERHTLDHNPVALREYLRQEEAARDLGSPTSPAKKLREAFAYKWLGEDAPARKWFREALAAGLGADDRRAALRGLIELLDHNPDARLERRRVLDDLLADESLAPSYVWWGLHRGVRDALDENDAPAAKELLGEHSDRLSSSDLSGYLNYLQALIALHEGRPQEAEPLVRWIDDWLGANARSNQELDDFGHLASLNRWLMGQIHLAEHQAEEAYGAFEEALQMQRSRDLRIAASVGRGRALVALGRHEDARVAFRHALDSLGGDADRRDRAAREFQRALCDAFDERQAASDFPNALAYLTMAAELTPKPASEDEGATVAHAADDALPKGDELAWSRVQKAATLLALDEPRLSWFLWSAADTYDRAGRSEDLCQVLHRFAEGRSTNPRMPEALLKLGHAYEALGRPAEAREWYGRVAEEYPRLGEAVQAQVLTAGLLVSLGPEHYGEAEGILTDTLINGSVTPDSAVYRDALLSLCDLLNHEGRYADSISRLYEFLGLYPDDPGRERARFALADAHRQSGYALRDSPPNGATPPAAEATSRERFGQAAELFDELARDLESEPELDEARQLYARLAVAYRADCLFELDDPERREETLTAYREVAARFDGQPPALVARVQIANLLLRAGDTREAARTLEGARWLLARMKPDDFGAHDGSSRADWEKFLAVVSSTEPFAHAFSGGP